MLAPDQPLDTLLAAIVGRYEQPDVPPAEKLPPRRYIGHGGQGVAADTASLMVAAPSVSTTEGEQKAVAANTMSTQRATIHARLLRPASQFDARGNPPTAQKITTESQILARDVARLLEAWRAWIDVLAEHLQVTPGKAEAIAPSGQLAGWRVTGTLGPL